MSTRAGPEDEVRTLLDAAAPLVRELPDPFSAAFTPSGARSGPAPPARLLVHLARLHETDRDIMRTFQQRLADMTRDVSRRGFLNSSVYDTQLRQLSRQRDDDRFRSRERWLSEMPAGDRAVLDEFCLAVAGLSVRPLIPASAPPSLHGPMTRLVLEYAALARQAATEQQEHEESLARRGLTNPSVIRSARSRSAADEQDDQTRLIARWFRELTPEQTEALDAFCSGREGEVAPAGHSPATVTDAPAHLTHIAEKVRGLLTRLASPSVDGAITPSDWQMKLEGLWSEARAIPPRDGNPIPPQPAQLVTREDLLNAARILLTWLNQQIASAQSSVPGATPSEQPTIDPMPVSFAGVGGAPEDPRRSPIPLRGWKAIFAALNEPHGKQEFHNTPQARQHVLSLNEKLNGPILPPGGKGRQPEVEKAALMAWWKGPVQEYLTSRHRGTAQKDADAKLTTAETYDHGRDGTVVPGIAGHVKKSRKKKK